MSTKKPRVFVASAAESLDIADAINVNLDHQAEVTVWKNGFKLSTDSISSLMDKAKAVDFAIFVFTPDDLSTIREQDKVVIRDNVLFELGLFIGNLGKERCFIVKPRGIDLHFPTDLLGLTPADYEAERSDDDLSSAVNHPCVLIRKEIERLGLLSEQIKVQQKERKIPAYNYEVGKTEREVMKSIMEYYLDSPDGVLTSAVIESIDHSTKAFANIAAVKLERLGFIERGIFHDDRGYEYYTFATTADGMDYILENTSLFEVPS